jgi:tetratricopeptide (TPR) repeat protein/DNA-binding winged helix-turn-helix (wHTH) protein
MLTEAPIRGYRIGPYHLDLYTGELRKNGRRIPLQEKPRSVLIALAEGRGDLVTRKELQDRLWAGNTFVDFENGLNTAIRKLREALDDDVQAPRHVETVRGRGYRLLTSVEPIYPPPPPAPLPARAPSAAPHEEDSTQQVEPGQESLPGATPLAPPSEVVFEPPPTGFESVPAAGRPNHSWVRGVLRPAAGAAVLASAIVAGFFWYTYARSALPAGARSEVLIADVDNQTGDARFDHALNTALAVGLDESHRVNLFPRLRVVSALHRMELNPETKITPEIASEICKRENVPGLVAPSITRTGDTYRLAEELVDPASGTVLSSHSATAHGEGEILAALDQLVGELRRDLGESRFQIRQSHRPLPQVTTRSFSALEQYAEGYWLWNHDHYDDAMQHYRQAIGIDPDFAMAHAALGSAYYSSIYNEPGLGEREFLEALSDKAQTTDRERASIASRYAASQGRIEDALRLYRALLAQWPGDFPARQEYARLLRLHGYPEEALSLYRQLLDEDPDDPSAYIEMASAYAQTGRLADSIQAYRNAVTLDPAILQQGDVDREYGLLLMRTGDDDHASQVFSALLANSKTYAEAQRSLAFLDLYHGRYRTARLRLSDALGHTQDPIALFHIRYMLAEIAGSQGNRDEQISLLDRMARDLDQIEEPVSYGSLLGQAYARAGEVGKASKILSAVAPLANGRAEEQIAFLQILKAEIAGAQGDADHALSLLASPQPSDGSAAATLVEEARAEICQKTGRIDEAMIWYDRFINSPDLGPIGWEPQQKLFESYYTLAADYASKGDRASALRTLSALLSRWENADPQLPLHRNALSLENRLIARQ